MESSGRGSYIIRKIKAFISFDYDNDKELKHNIIAQSRLPDSPFEIIDLSIEKAIDEKWKEQARRQIRNSDIVIFICGSFSDQAKGVTAEMSITTEEKKRYILLRGRKDVQVKKPIGSRSEDEVYPWKWKILKKLVSEM